MFIFYDTCSLLSELKDAFRENNYFIISDITLLELEEIKTSGHKDEEIKVRHPDFPNNYIDHIKENIGKYDCIFVSSHASVREGLDKEGIDFTIVYPEARCKAEWVGRCFIRDKNGESGCGAEAMYNNWEQWILECVETGINHDEIVLGSRKYLSDVFVF